MHLNLSEEKLTEILAIARSASIQCSICQDNVTNPLLLSCKHYFCASCLKSYFTQAGQNNRKCPNCLTPIQPRSYYECPELENPFTDLIDMIEKKSNISLPLGLKMPLQFINYPKNRYKCKKPIERRKSIRVIKRPKRMASNENLEKVVSDLNIPAENIKENFPINSNIQLAKRNRSRSRARTEVSVPNLNGSKRKTKTKNGQDALSEMSKLQIEITPPKNNGIINKPRGRQKKSVVDLKDNTIGVPQNRANVIEPGTYTETRSRKSLRIKKPVNWLNKSQTNLNLGKINSITVSNQSGDDLFQNASDQGNLSDIYSLASYRFPESFKLKTYNSTKIRKAPTLASLDIEEDAIQKVNEWMSRDDYDFKNVTSITISDKNGQTKRVKKSKSFHGGVKQPNKRTRTLSHRITRSCKKTRKSNHSDDSRLGGLPGLAKLDIQIEPNKQRSKTPKKDEGKMIEVELKTQEFVVPVKTNIDLKLFSSIPTVILEKIEPERITSPKQQTQILNSCPTVNNEKLTDSLFNISETIIPMVELMERAAQTFSMIKNNKSKQRLLQEMFDFSKQIRDKLNSTNAHETRISKVKCPNCSHNFTINSNAVDCSGSDMDVEILTFHKNLEILESTNSQRKRNQPSSPCTPRKTDPKKICLDDNLENSQAEEKDAKTPSRHSSASSDNLDVIESTPGERKKSLRHSSVFSSRKSLENDFKGFNVTEIDLPASIIPGTESADYAESRLIAVLPPPPEFGDPITENETKEQPPKIADVTELNNCKNLTSLVKIDQSKEASIIEDADGKTFHSIIEATPISPKNAKEQEKLNTKVQSPIKPNEETEKELETEKDIFKTPNQINDNGPLKIIKNIVLNSPTTRKRQSTILDFSCTNSSQILPTSQKTNSNLEKNVANSLSLSTLPNTQQFFNQLEVASTPKTQNQTKLVNQKTICVATSRLSLEDSMKVKLFCKKFGAKFTTKFEDMTHLVAQTKKNNAIANRTVKYLYAVSHHLWVVNVNWITESLENNKLLPENNYECLDQSSLPGPRSSRILGNKALIFQNFAFYLGTLNQCMPPYILTKCLINCGGKVFTTLKELIDQPKAVVKIVVSEIEDTDDLDPSSDFATNYRVWYEKYKIITVDVTWICKVVGRNRLIALENIVGCDYSEKAEGYPSELFASPQPDTSESSSEESSSQEED